MLHRQLSAFSTASSSSNLMRKCLRLPTTSSNGRSSSFSTSSLSLQQTRGMSSCSSSNNLEKEIISIRKSLEKLVDDQKSLHNAVKDWEKKCVTKSDRTAFEQKIDYLRNKLNNRTDDDWVYCFTFFCRLFNIIVCVWLGCSIYSHLSGRIENCSDKIDGVRKELSDKVDGVRTQLSDKIDRRCK